MSSAWPEKHAERRQKLDGKIRHYNQLWKVSRVFSFPLIRLHKPMGSSLILTAQPRKGKIVDDRIALTGLNYAASTTNKFSYHKFDSSAIRLHITLYWPERMFFRNPESPAH
jgi:hypothetical protein